MKELLEILARALVDHPDEVDVTEVEGEQSVVFELRVNPDDLGKVIGRQGRIAKSLRTVIKAAAMREGKRATVDIVD